MMERDDLLTAQRYPYWNRCYHGDRMECWIMLAAGDNGGFGMIEWTLRNLQEFWDDDCV